jgi:hypothetical protein
LTPTTYGSGEHGESFRVERESPGDILPGVYDVVPAARSTWENIEIGGPVPEFQLWNFTLGHLEAVSGVHWGFGIVLLDRDATRIRPLLHADFRTKGLSPHTLSALLRGFFPGRSYCRLYFLGGSRGVRLNKYPYMYWRLEAIRSEYKL